MSRVVIRNGVLIDGTNAPRRKADIAIEGQRIVAIADAGTLRSSNEVDANGLIVAPGFIDVHTHDDEHLISHPAMAMKASQGVTTVIAGNCGASGAPCDREGPPPALLRLVFKEDANITPTMAAFIARVEAAKPAVNAAFLVGHSTLRVDAMGDDLGRAATGPERKRMREKLDAALADGAIGLSSGLFYPPARSAPAEELIEIGMPLGRHRAVYTAHIRDESEEIMAALDEAFRIGRETGAANTIISHHKCAGLTNFGRSRDTLALIERTSANQPVAFDVYPYVAGSTILLPEMVERASKVLVTWSDAKPEISARDLDEVAKEWKCSRQEAATRLQPAGAIYFMMDEADVRRIMSHPKAMIGSDGIPGDKHPHPRLWGTFPRVLGHYAREVRLFSLEEAVYRMTGLSACNFNLRERGTLAVGNFADIVLFDDATVADRATFEAPMEPAAGIKLVLVNGQAVWNDGKATGNRPGQALRHAA